MPLTVKQKECQKTYTKKVRAELMRMGIVATVVKFNRAERLQLFNQAPILGCVSKLPIIVRQLVLRALISAGATPAIIERKQKDASIAAAPLNGSMAMPTAIIPKRAKAIRPPPLTISVQVKSLADLITLVRRTARACDLECKRLRAMKTSNVDPANLPAHKIPRPATCLKDYKTVMDDVELRATKGETPEMLLATFKDRLLGYLHILQVDLANTQTQLEDKGASVQSISDEWPKPPKPRAKPTPL